MRKSTKSLRKSTPSKLKKKIECDPKCSKRQITSLNIQHSLSRKYSSTQNFHYLNTLNHILQSDFLPQEISNIEPQEHLEQYCKTLNRKHIFPKIKEVYKLHTDIPRIFQPQVKEILNKCYHRKRLLEYFKIAKVLGIKVESVKFSSFLISLNDVTNKKERKNFDPIITKISTIDFSTEAEKDLLEEFLNFENESPLSLKENIMREANLEGFK